MWLNKFLKGAFPFYLLFAYVALVLLSLPLWMQGVPLVKALLLPTRVLLGVLVVIVLLMVWRKNFPLVPTLVGGLAGVVFAVADFLLFHYLALQGYYYIAHNIYFISLLGAITAFLIACLAFREVRNIFYLKRRT